MLVSLLVVVVAGVRVRLLVVVRLMVRLMIRLLVMTSVLVARVLVGVLAWLIIIARMLVLSVTLVIVVGVGVRHQVRMGNILTLNYRGSRIHQVAGWCLVHLRASSRSLNTALLNCWLIPLVIRAIHWAWGDRTVSQGGILGRRVVHQRSRSYLATLGCRNRWFGLLRGCLVRESRGSRVQESTNLDVGSHAGLWRLVGIALLRKE